MISFFDMIFSYLRKVPLVNTLKAGRNKSLLFLLRKYKFV